MRVSSILLWLVVTMTATASASADILRIHGSNTVYANILQPNQEAIEHRSGHSLMVVSNGSGRGLQDLVVGRANLGMISAPLESTIRKAKTKNAAFDDSGLMAHKISEIRTAFIVHPSNPVRSLNLEQVAAILEGHITNWQEIGGPSRPIVLICEDRNRGLRAMTEKALIEGRTIVHSARQLPSGTQIVNFVAKMPMAFGVTAAATVDQRVREISTDEPISQPLILVTRGEPTPIQRAVIDAARAVGG